MNAMDMVRSLSDEELVDCYATNGSINGIGRALGISCKAPCVRQLINQRLQQLGDVIRKRAVRNNYTDDDIKNAVANALCMSDVLRQLGLSTHGSNAASIRRKIEALGLSLDHFDIKATFNRNKDGWSDADIFVKDSPIPRATLNSQVRRRNVLGTEVCTECGVGTTYNNKPIRLTVDHINGISDDNRIENLRWLCHNCHSQTENYQGKGKRKHLTMVL